MEQHAGANVEVRRPIGEAVADPFNTRFDAEALWEDTRLRAGPQGVTRPVARTAAGGGTLVHTLSFPEARLANDELGGVLPPPGGS